MILTLLLSSKSLWSQTNEQKDSLVVVSIELIKEANIKLAEGKYYKNLADKQQELIFDLEELNYAKSEKIKGLETNMYKLYDENKQYKDINSYLEHSLNKSKKANYILGSVALTTTIIAVLSIIIQ